MISIRQLLVVAFVTVGLWLLKRLQTRLKARHSGTEVAKNIRKFEDTVRCSRCGTHITRSEAVDEGRKGFYCADRNCLNRDTSDVV